MPLSDEHRQALDEIERALELQDPEFAASVGTGSFRRLRRRWVIIPAAMFLVGAVVLVAGLVTTHAQLLVGAVVGIAGLLVMAAAVVLLVRRNPQLGSLITAADRRLR